MRVFLNSLAMAFFILAMPVKDACATVDVWDIFQSHSKVFINCCSNHGSYPSDVTFRYLHEVDALNFVRRKLVKRGDLQNIPVVIDIPCSASSTSAYSYIALEKNGSLTKGDAGTIPIGACYQIQVGKNVSNRHGALLALAVALQNLTKAKQKIDVTDIKNLKLAAQASSEFRNIKQYYDPIWSPDGRLLLYTVWQEGAVHFELLEPIEESVRKMEPLDDYMVARPVWSPDSRYVAYATFDEIKVFDTKTEETKVLSLLGTSAYEVLLSFDKTREKLIIAHDTNLLANYFVYDYDLKRQKITTVASNVSRPAWAKDSASIRQYYSQTRVPGPDGKRSALIEEAYGLKRVVVRSAIKTTKVATLPVLSVGKSSAIIAIPSASKGVEWATSRPSPAQIIKSPAQAVETSLPSPAPGIAAVVAAVSLIGIVISFVFYFRRKR